MGGFGYFPWGIGDLPPTLPAIAAEVPLLFQNALKEAVQPSPNNTIIGNNVKTALRIINVQNGYRDRVTK